MRGINDIRVTLLSKAFLMVQFVIFKYNLTLANLITLITVIMLIQQATLPPLPLPYTLPSPSPFLPSSTPTHMDGPPPSAAIFCRRTYRFQRLALLIVPYLAWKD